MYTVIKDWKTSDSRPKAGFNDDGINISGYFTKSTANWLMLRSCQHITQHQRGQLN